MIHIPLSKNISISHIGPDFKKGALPSVFYFALSSKESLDLDPYNQPALFLAKRGIRLFSIDLPAHGPEMNAIEAIGVWARQFAEGQDPLSPFIEQILWIIETLIEKGLIIKEKIGLMGLSRGGFIACHVAAKLQMVRATVAFAPMTSLSYAQEFQQLQKELQGSESVQKLDLMHIVDLLSDHPLHFYIGNRDMRVGTERCFQLIHSLANAAFIKGVRSPPARMTIAPSIGHMGHGTSKETFTEGAKWLGKELGETFE